VEELSEIRFKYAEDLLEEGQSFVAYVAFCGKFYLFVFFFRCFLAKDRVLFGTSKKKSTWSVIRS
jgi:hypothetical protein